MKPVAAEQLQMQTGMNMDLQGDAKESSLELSPSQQKTFDWFDSAWDKSNIFHLWSANGFGRTLLLAKLQAKFGGVRIGLADYVAACRGQHPLSIEDAFYHMLIKVFEDQELVFVDDWHVATAPMNGDTCHFGPRTGYFQSPASALASYVQDSGKKLVVATDGSLCLPIRSRATPYPIERFTAEDYAFISLAHAEKEAIQNIDFDKVHRFAPKLNAHQLKSASIWALKGAEINTEEYIDYLRSQQLSSNVELGEVSNISLDELKGIDDVIESLEANIILPFENDEMSRELNLKPKRGVLLAGPPGTGKTTIGKALAHRLKGKFFLIDGTIISGTRDFYDMVNRIFEYAKENAPSVIFIDDSDVIFESGQEHGLYRYLLTMLDGLESESAGRVCVILTAMDVGNLPPALVRSGRIELWLDTRFPDVPARRDILESQVSKLVSPLNNVNIDRITEASEGQSGADLKRIVEEAKALYAYDLVKNRQSTDVTDYFLSAIANVHDSRQKYAQAEARANANRSSRPTWFNPDLHSYEALMDDNE